MRMATAAIRPEIVACGCPVAGRLAPGPLIAIIILAIVNFARLTELLSEIVILALGLLLAMMALTGRFNLPAGLSLWLGLGAVLLFWGARAWMKIGRYARPAARSMQWVRGGSLLLAGAIMIAMAGMPFGDAPGLLALVGAILAVRGAIGAALAARRAFPR